MLYFHFYSGLTKYMYLVVVVPQALIIQVFTVKECFHACWLVKSYTLEMSWGWFNFGSNFVTKLFQKWASKTVNVIVKTNQQQLIFQWSKLYALINPRNDVKMLKNFGLTPLTCSAWFHFRLEHYDVFSMVIKRINCGKLFLICYIYGVCTI